MELDHLKEEREGQKGESQKDRLSWCRQSKRQVAWI